MMWFFRHFWIFISYHISLLNQVEGAIAIPPSNSAPLPLFCPSVCLSSIGLLTTFSGFCTFADKSLGRNGIELEMQMFLDDLPLANIDADGYCCHFMRSSVRPTIHGLGFVYCIQSAWKKWPTIWHADVSRWLTLTGWPRSGWPQVGHFDQKIKVNQIASYCAMLYPRCCSLWPCTFWGLHSSTFDSSAGQTRGSHFNFYWGTDTTMWSYVHFLCSCVTKIDFYHLLWNWQVKRLIK